MNFHILTLFPEMVMGGLNTSITGRAIDKGLISVEAVNIRDYSKDKHHHVDDAPYGGGAGMVMQPEPIYDAYEALAARTGKRPRVIYLTPQGQVFNQKIAEELAKEEDLVFLCGHYEGIDERALELVVTDTMKELRDELGYVPQKGILFSGTIESNIKFGAPEASMDIVKEAAEIAQATEFIETKSAKYESPIAQGGTNVSGGQKQRLSIARAIAKNPKIFIFDDSFSALDLKTDAALRKALASKVTDSTVIIVAQRISTILHADQILVMDEGKIVGKGTHEELLKNCEVYQQIAKSQMSAKELGIDGKEEA